MYCNLRVECSNDGIALKLQKHDVITTIPNAIGVRYPCYPIVLVFKHVFWFVCDKLTEC